MSYKRFAVDEKNDCTTVNLLNSFQGEFFFFILRRTITVLKVNR